MLRYGEKMTKPNLESTIRRLIRINNVMKAYNISTKFDESDIKDMKDMEAIIRHIEGEYDIEKLIEGNILELVVKHEAEENHFIELNEEETAKITGKLKENLLERS